MKEIANSNANADPAFLLMRGCEAADKGIRDDGGSAFLRSLQSSRARQLLVYGVSGIERERLAE